MTSSTDLLRLQILSELSLPENIFLAAFLAQSHHYLPSLSNSYCLFTKKLQPLDIYDEHHQQTLTNTISALLRRQLDLDLGLLVEQDSIVTSYKTWQQHQLTKPYRQTFVHSGYHQSLMLPVKHSNNFYGLLIFNRNRHDSAFNSLSVNMAKLIRDELETGLTKCSGEKYNKTTTGWRSGLIIVDQRGEITQCCQEGYNLLALALQKKPGNLQSNSFADVRSFPGVLQMIDVLLNVDNPVSNSELTVNSLWGEFKINGYPVLDKIGQRAPQVYLNITWQVPFSLVLFHNIETMCFTPRQQLIALLYAAGESTKAIANKLELSLYTVKEHVQHIFEKLQIHTRAELIEHILCRDAGPVQMS